MNADYRDVSSVTIYRLQGEEIRTAVSADHFYDLAEYDGSSFLIGSIAKNGRQSGVASTASELGNVTSGSVNNYGNDGETATITGTASYGFRILLSSGAYGSYHFDLLDIGPPTFKSGVGYSVGANISLTGVGAEYDPIMIAINKNGRHADFCTTRHDLIQSTTGVCLNFGSDGVFLTITGNSSDGFRITTTDPGISSINVTITNLATNTKDYGVSRVINNYSVPSGAVLPVSTIKNINNLVFVTINQNGRCAGFWGIGSDLYKSNFGSVVNFGPDGCVAALSGNGETGLTITSSSTGKIVVNMYELAFRTDEKSIVDLIYKNSFTDFHLVPTQRLGVNPSSPQYTSYQISGTSERVDVTELAENGLHYSHRTGSWDFYIDHEQWPDWPTSFNTISGFLNGYKVLAVLEEDPYRAYQGYVKVAGYSPGGRYSTFTIAYDFEYETALGFHKYPIKFIKSDGTYHDLEYVFSPGTEYVLALRGPFIQRLLLDVGLYSRKYVAIGGLIVFDSLLTNDALTFLSIYESGRFFGVSGRASDLANATAGELKNFGSDGVIAFFKGNEYSGVTIGTSLSTIKGTYVTMKETEPIALYNKTTCNLGAWIGLNGVSSQDSFLSISIMNGARYLSFVSTARDLCGNTHGSVYSFGDDGYTIIVKGNGSNAFTVEATGAQFTNVLVSVFEVDATSVYSRDTFSNGETISLAQVSNNDMLAVSMSYGGRRIGFCVTKTDLINCDEEKVFNIGEDGSTAVVYGDSSYGFCINSEDYQNATWSVSIGIIS